MMSSPHKVSVDAPAYCEIRPATARDLPEVVELWGELAAHHASLDGAFAPSARWKEEYHHFVRSLLGRDDALVVAADDGRRLLGFAVGRISLLPGFFEHRRRGYIHDVVTRPGHRRQGIGRRLVEALLEWMRASGVTTAELTVAVRNREALAFWRRLGFSFYMRHLKRDLR